MTEYLTGYIGITVVLILTGCGLPVPEEVPIVTAGVLSAGGTLYWPIALACTIFGALMGDCAMYWIGYHFGRAVLKDHPWWVGFLTPEREKKAEYMIRHHGLRLLLIVRFLPGLRLPVYLTTGILKMPFRRFVLIDLLCAGVVVGTFFGLAYVFGQQIKDVIQSAERWALVAVISVGALFAIAYFVRSRRRLAQIKRNSADGVGVRAADSESVQSDGIAQPLADEVKEKA